MRKRQKGFSLIELLIVVAIILIIAAIAIPNLLSARMSANEASAVGSMRTLNTACITYSSTWGIGFPAAFSNLGPAASASSTAADLIDSGLIESRDRAQWAGDQKDVEDEGDQPAWRQVTVEHFVAQLQ